TRSSGIFYYERIFEREENSIFGREYKFVYSRGESATWLPFTMGFRVSDVIAISHTAYIF
uniref:hypothetical protein n=1 Tax=Leuconostoc mesenteroides TaxID=1245 RepID=UPI00235E09ED